MKLEFSIRANQLKNVAGAFKGTSDPFAIVTRLSTGNDERPVVLGKTEVVKNNLNPDWVKVFTLDYELGTPQVLAVNIFDEVRKGSNIGMGAAVFDVGELLGSRGNTLAKRLKKGGNLFATVRKSEGTGTFHFKFRGEKLKNVEGFFGKSDPFFEINRKVSNVSSHSWDVVYRSRVCANNLNPAWEEGSLEMSILCGGDSNLPLQITIYDHEKSGKHVFMGSIETTVNALTARGKDGMTLIKDGKITGKFFADNAQVSGQATPPTQQQQQMTPPTQQMAEMNLNNVPVAATTATATGVAIGAFAPMAPPQAHLATSATAAGVACGAFVPMAPPATAPQAQPLQRASSGNKELFVDYISGGCELSVAVAIDFTGSNGDPRVPGTLHHISPHQRNCYEQAISAIVSILLQYDHDKKIPVYGFGAKYDGVVRHCFQCGPTAEADGLQGVMDAYKSVFTSKLILSRPTVFTDVLETAAQKAESNQEAAASRGSQAYTILLIVTDGAVSDVNATAEYLRLFSNSPLSVVIVGVGNADFSAMRFLDDVAATTGDRDIAQFVAFNQHSHSSQSLTKATLEEIPKQLVEYFQREGIQPLPPQYRGDDSLSMLIGEAEEEINLNLDIGEQEIVVTGGGYGYVGGFNAR